jgi:hypothetical protein
VVPDVPRVAVERGAFSALATEQRSPSVMPDIEKLLEDHDRGRSSELLTAALAPAPAWAALDKEALHGLVRLAEAQLPRGQAAAQRRYGAWTRREERRARRGRGDRGWRREQLGRQLRELLEPRRKAVDAAVAVLEDELRKAGRQPRSA